MESFVEHAFFKNELKHMFNYEKKIKMNELSGFRQLNKFKIGFTCSCWDLLHAGHHLFLEEAKKNCDFLVVGIQTDPTLDRPEKNKPIQSLEERIIQLASCMWVDYYFVYDSEQNL
jgi:glycerol-3-phosphate cytidylyltransferase